MSRIRAFIACSLDGFIAGPDDELDWLPDPPEGEDMGWHAFIASVGCVLVGRRTWDVVAALDVAWPHLDERETLVATRRPLDAPPPRVQGAAGSIAELLDRARALAAGGDVYLDGGDLLRQALDADLLDEAIVTLIPVVLGAGRPLFAGCGRRHPLRLTAQRALPGGVVQLTYDARGASPVDAASLPDA